MDSTNVELPANCMDWALCRRHEAAAKFFVRTNFESLLPACGIVDPTREADIRRARDLTAALEACETSYLANGSLWQIWVALPVHLILRNVASAGPSGPSFVRLCALARVFPWRELSILALMDRYGKGKGGFKIRAALLQAYLVGFAWVHGKAARVFGRAWMSR